jgi:amino acid adenylation domain-containing protein
MTGPITRELPLSFAQEQLWFIDQYHCLPTYNIAGMVRLTGNLDVAALAAAVTALVTRHETLRSRLVADVDGRPVQLVDPPARIELPCLDLSDEPDPQARLTELAEAGALEAVDLAHGPVFRAKLLKLSDTDSALLLTSHCIVFDSWSFQVLLPELAALYHQQLTGLPAELPELPIQFADHALAERERLTGSVLADLLEYWRPRLAGVETVQLPTDRPRPMAADHSGRIATLELSRDLLDRLRSVARQAGTEPLVVLLAGLQALLHRYTGQADIVVGTLTPNRERAELASLIGLVATTLPIRTDLSGDPSFRELLARVAETTAGAQAHSELPFAKLVDLLGVQRDTSRAPIFQVALSYAEAPAPVQLPELRLELQPVPLKAAKFDLDLLVEERAGALSVQASYPPALYDPPTVQRLLGHFRVLLEAALGDPALRVSELPMLTDAELQDEIHNWNNTAAEFPVTCIHEQFEQAAERYPDAIAGRFVGEAGEQLSYAELNAQANRIGRRLVELGVGPEVLVGVCMRPSVRRLAVLLAIMKAGGGYVPLDPELPAERLSFLISDTAMPVIVADPASEPGLPATAATILSVEAEWPAILGQDGGNLDLALQPSNVAYVIYTSGSTGQPKGVVVEHRHALNFLLGMIEHWKIGPDDRVLQFASLNFDVSVMDMFMTLCSGATAILADRQTLISPPRLAELMRAERVSFACMPPAVVNLLTGQEFPDLRVLLSAGEELSAELVKAWLRPGLHFYNGYGPTEAAIGACFGEMDGTIFPPPIGRPKPNYQVYVLDQYLNPLPVGAIGELHIGGAGVTRGYLNRPELTAERFISDPFRKADGARLYKTGDLVKRLPDGSIAFVGRIDGQVKIRGLRVELGEIESAMRAVPGVAQAVVTVLTDPAGQKQLAGYLRIEPEAAADFSVADLRAELGQRLPAYMVPASLLVLDRFPLTHNGKIDKAALPAPDASSGKSYLAPSTLIETVVVDMYAGLLNCDQVGTEDSFFDIGGSSLQAMQLVTRLRSDLAVDVDVATVFLAPTPKQLSAVLRDKYGLEDVELGEQGLDGLIEQEPQPS